VFNSVLVGDARKLIKEIPDSSVDLIVTSPPYWNAVRCNEPGFIGNSSYEEYIEDLLKVWRECERILVPNGKLCIVTPIMPIPKKLINTQHTRHIKNINNDIEFSILQETGLLRYGLFIWQKQTSKLIFGSYPYPGNIYEQNTVEFINVFVKGGKPKPRPKKVKEKNKLTLEEWRDLTQQVWFIYPEDVKRKLHPAPFPEKLAARLIRLYTYGECPEEGYEGDVVFDPFAGIGTTLVAAKKMGRRFLGIELITEYADVAKERLEKAEREDINLFIGFPKYPGRKELEEIYRERKERKEEREKLEKKHKSTSYGKRAYSKGELPLFEGEKDGNSG